ncbi:MAG: hypothetical protein WCS31_06625 [Verrucomicrobiae bacterium]
MFPKNADLEIPQNFVLHPSESRTNFFEGIPATGSSIAADAYSVIALSNGYGTTPATYASVSLLAPSSSFEMDLNDGSAWSNIGIFSSMVNLTTAGAFDAVIPVVEVNAVPESGT